MSPKQPLTTKQKDYQKLENKDEMKRPLLRNCIKAFLVGGFICLIGQCITVFYIYFFNFTKIRKCIVTRTFFIFIQKNVKNIHLNTNR